jgi:hypothetical protein
MKKNLQVKNNNPLSTKNLQKQKLKMFFFLARVKFQQIQLVYKQKISDNQIILQNEQSKDPT